MSRQRIGRHERRPQPVGYADREAIKRASAERVAAVYEGRHRA